MTRVGLGPVVVYALLLSGAAWGLRTVDRTPPGSFPAVVLPMWAVLTPLALALLVWVVVAARRYPPGSRLLAVGLPLLGLVVALDVVRSRPGPPAPAGLPAEVTTLPVADGVLSPDARAAVVFRATEGPTPLTVEFRPVNALGAHWAYEGGVVESEAFPAVPIPGRGRDWTGTVAGGITEVTPAYRVDLPLGAEHEHREVVLRARMDLTYPAFALGGYTDEEEPRRRDVALFVGSAEDRAFRVRWDAWQQGRGLDEGWWVVSAAAGLLALVPTAVGLRRFARAHGRGSPLPRRPDGGEVHDLVAQVARERSAGRRP